mmetsp:Transcript_1756/g.3850  ORF Transcript_1756/g.3850 Transcript_1756/m.3850 type:complete len:243 (+) Transcript_1756:152-880(+)
MSESAADPSWATSPDQSSTYRRNASQEDEESKPVLGDQSSIHGGTSSVGNPPSNARTWPHKFFRLFKLLNIAFAFFLLVAQAVSVVYLPFDFVELLLKLFVASFCVMFIMNELETSKILRDSPLLWNWVPRGYFYAFVGVVSVEENNLKPRNASEYSFAALTSSYSSAMFIEVASWMMFVLGVLYIIFGLLFGQRYHNKLREDYNNRVTERRRMLGESGLRSNSFNIPIQHYGESKQGGVMS